MTVLANEQVIDGKGWRSGAPVERRKLSQWFLKITDFADDLLDGLKTLDEWPEKVRLMQENWIGKSRGLQFRFRLAQPVEDGESIEVFTTRPDTIFGASFVAVAADHPIAAGDRRTGSGGGQVHRRVPRGRHQRGRHRNRGEERLSDAGRSRPSARPRMAAAGVHRELRADGLWHRRDVRRSRPRPARFRVCEAISSADQTRRCGERRARFRADRRRGRTGAGNRGKLPVSRRIDDRTGRGRGHPPRRGGGLGPRHRPVSPARLGRVAPALLGHADPDHPLPGMRAGRGAARPAARHPARGRELRRSGQPARPPSDLEARRMPVVRRPGDARDRHARHLRRFELVFHPLREPARRQAVRSRGGRRVAAGRAIYRRRRACDPAPALRALLDAGAAADREDRHRRAVQGPVHARHGHA